MAQYLFPPAVPAALRVVGETALFPVRRVVCRVLTVPSTRSADGVYSCREHSTRHRRDAVDDVESSTPSPRPQRTQVYCVGRNYRAHSREMIQRQAAQLDITDDKVDAPPFFFQKPAYGAVTDSRTVPYPPTTLNGTGHTDPSEFCATSI